MKEHTIIMILQKKKNDFILGLVESKPKKNLKKLVLNDQFDTDLDEQSIKEKFLKIL